jgi:hypothetical protein
LSVGADPRDGTAEPETLTGCDASLPGPAGLGHEDRSSRTDRNAARVLQSACYDLNAAILSRSRREQPREERSGA